MWERSSPVGDNALARKVARNYARAADIHVPALWPQIAEALAWLHRIAGFGGIMLTGSVILRRADSYKDLDIVLRFDDINGAITVKDHLPETIAGIKTDFFYYIGERPDVYFACLDCEARKLFVSRWLPLTINSIEAGIEVIEQGSNEFGSQVIKRLAEKDGAAFRQARIGWNGVFREWRRLTSFIAAARSRGIMATAKHVAGIDNQDGFHCDAETLAARQASCFGDAVTAPCAVLVENARGQKFCGACGCGESTIARLDGDSPEDFTKLHYPILRCPLGKKGFTT